MSDAKMSDERAREILTQMIPADRVRSASACVQRGDLDEERARFGDYRILAEVERSQNEACEALAIGAAAIAEREDLLDAIELAVIAEDDLEDLDAVRFERDPLLMRLVKHGRVIRDGETYKWSDRR